MRMLVSVVFGSVLTALAGASGSELVDSDLSPEEVIERLKEVRKDWEEVEIKYAQFECRPVFDGAKGRLTEWGRFVIMPGDCGELETYVADKKGHKPEGDPEARYVWTPDEFQIHSPDGHMKAISRVDLRNARAEEPNNMAEQKPSQEMSAKSEPVVVSDTSKEPVTLGRAILRCLLAMFEFKVNPISWQRAVPESPKDCLPLVFADDASALAERFDLSVMENDENIFLFARPRLLEDQRNCRQTAISIDRHTFIPVAKRTVLPGGRDYFTWVVTSLRVNGEDVSVRRASTGEQSRE